MNNLNDQLVQQNRILREDLEEIHTNYVELVQATKEDVRRRKLAQENNEELSRKNQYLQEKLQALDKEYSRL